MNRLSHSSPTRAAARQRASFVTRRTSEGVIASYIHHNGRLGVLVEVNCETERGARAPELSALARDLAEHIAAAAPLSVRLDDLPADLLEKRRREFEDELRRLRAQGIDTRVVPLLKTRQEAGRIVPLYLDMVEDARLLVDRGGFFAAVLAGLRERLAALGAERRRRGSVRYWILKRDFRPGERIEL